MGLLVIGLSSCDLDEFPMDELTPETFFKNENDLKLYTNSFYSMFPGASTFYAESTDITIGRDLPEAIRGARVVPNTGGGWNWENLRKINYYLEHSSQCSDINVRNRYDALARFFRAYFYYDMVKKFGEVPWYESVLSDNDPGLKAARMPREELMKNVLTDINFAIDYLPKEKSSVNTVNRWTALALKSRICLFEGTFRKYHTKLNLSNTAEEYLSEAVKAAEEVIDRGPYELHKTGNSDTDYRDLFVQNDSFDDEVILAKSYGMDGNQYHDANYFRLSSSAEILGLEKAFVNSYLMKDGTRFTDKEGYETMEFIDEVKDRDPRLAQTIRTPGYTRIGDTQQLAPDLSLSITGYTLIKYLSGKENDSNQKDISDIPLFRLAEVMLNFAEAKAELGNELTQADLDKSINKLRERVGMTGKLSLEDANKNPDSYLKDIFYPNIEGANKGIILEIRRERTIELIQEGFRWDDVIRWRCGKAFLRQFEGMYFPQIGKYDLNNDGKPDLCIYKGDKPHEEEGIIYKKLGTDIFLKDEESGCMQINATQVKKWDEEKDYFYPIPIQERLLNPNLTQNPGWDDGLE